MAAERDAQARMEQIIEQHVYGGNVIPFQQAKRQLPPTRVPVQGAGNVTVVGSHHIAMHIYPPMSGHD